MFSGPSRAMRASTLRNLHGIAAAAGPVTLTDAEIPALAARVAESAPAWDSPQGAYLADIVALQEVDARRVRSGAAAVRPVWLSWPLTGSTYHSRASAALGRTRRAMVA